MGMKDQFKNKAEELADQAKRSGGDAKGERSERPSKADEMKDKGRERAEGSQERMRDEFDA